MESIFTNTKGFSFEVILVDNASTDGSKEFFEKDQRIKYIYSNENLGFGRANNLGMEQAIGDYLFLLNSDTVLLNNAVGIFFNFAKSQNEKAIYGTWLLDSNRKRTHSYGYFPTIKSVLKNAAIVYIKQIPYLNKYALQTNEKYSEETLSVNYITGADLFVSRGVIKKCGMFDPRFFMYFEETDWQKRMDVQGIKRLLIHGPEIVHLCGVSQGLGTHAKSMRSLLNTTNGLFVYMHKYYREIDCLLFGIVYLLLRFPIVFSRSYTTKEKILYVKILVKYSFGL